MPELAAEITLQPVRRHGVDAAIFFSDIMTPLKLAGVDLDIVSGVGPVIAEPVRTRADVARLTALLPGDAQAVAAAVKLVVAELPQTTPLIGFAGAPFTLAAYLVEGKGSRDHLAARAMMHSDPESWHQLLSWCAQVSEHFLETQVAAGARAIQLFDSWAGALSRADYLEFVAPHSSAVLAGMAGQVPRIHFATASRHLLPDLAACGVEAVGVDYRTPLDEAATVVPGVPLQGNIDPARLLAGWGQLAEHASDVVRRGKAAPAHIVNLGHGVPPTTDPALLTDLVQFVHQL